MITRRLLLAGLAGTPLAACGTLKGGAPAPDSSDDEYARWYIGSMPDDPYPVPLVDRSLMKPELMRQEVAYRGSEKPGTIVVDIDQRFLYLVQDGGRAMRYGVGVGKQGFSWKGTARIGRKAKWPGWTPTATMVRLNPKLPKTLGPGLDNPLGARALYLYQGDRDTLFRLHGTNEPWTIGSQVSSGCIRLLNEDIVDLYERVPVGTTVLVRRGGLTRA